jgi:AraC family transcriptional regulator of adaptative response/methylated-DNA-[protein]-cysteine methyltransferase
LTKAKILAICRYIEEQIDHIPTLSELSSRFEISPSYLQREFKRVIGLSPFQYANALRSDRFKQRLQQGEEITRAVYDTGYGSSSRLYEKASKQLGMTPKTYRCSGKGMHITYTIVPCSLGYLLVATTEKGICAVKLGDEIDELERILLNEFNQAQILRDDNLHRHWLQTILNFITGDELHLDLPLDIRGTAFQKQVWQALQKIPYGETRTYADIAREIGKPEAVRAVGTACGSNPTALIVPCHRVLRTDGTLGGYHWGIERKEKLLAQEVKRTGKMPIPQERQEK